jgi:hypothetical protein
MATRSIVTSQPDVACDVCSRRLLRGEQPEVFLAGGGRRTVCELCMPRATHEGWLRESAGGAPSRHSPRGRRGRTLLDRLRQLREPASPVNGHTPTETQPDPQPEPFEFLSAPALESAPSQSSFLTESFGEPLEPLASEAHAVPAPAVEPTATQQLAIDAFNASEHTRRVAGVTRSLGEPTVTVREDDGEGRLLITVAWELCWYRYGVGEPDWTEVNVLAQGMELEELPPEDLQGNAAASDSGQLLAL